MSRTTLAVFAGLLFIFAYVITVITVPDFVGQMHWAVEAIYWALAGIIWVFPVRWLMLWSVKKR
jgi:hypothetical protein